MKFILLFFFLGISHSGFCQENSAIVILNNKVKEEKLLDSLNNLILARTYDSLGRTTYVLNDIIGNKFAFTNIFDNKGNRIRSIYEHRAFNTPQVWYHEFDDKHNETSIKDENGNLLFEYFYDDSNFLIKEITYYIDTNKKRITTFEKSEDGRKIVSKAGSTRVNTKYMDERGNVIRTDSYDGDILNSLIVYSYDSENRITDVIYGTEGDGRTNIYDLNGQLIRTLGFKMVDGVKQLTGENEEFEYNNSGLLIKYRGNRNKEKEVKYHYEYEFYK